MQNPAAAAPRDGSSMFNKIPWTFLIILYMLTVHFTGINMAGIPGYIFLALCMFVLFAEFFKSGDINATVFLIDLVAAVVSTVVATALMTLLLFTETEQGITFFHWFGWVIILGDAIFSPFNSFRTALRNFGLGG